MVSVMLYPWILCVALFVLCVACLTVVVNCFGVVVILLLNVMEVFSVDGGALLDGTMYGLQSMCVLSM